MKDKGCVMTTLMHGIPKRVQGSLKFLTMIGYHNLTLYAAFYWRVPV